MSERNYDFRKFLDRVHAKDLRDFDKTPEKNETVLDDSWTVLLPENPSDFVVDTAKDLADYLFVSMSISVRVKKGPSSGEKEIVLLPAGAPGKKRSFLLDAEEKRIKITGADERWYFIAVDMELPDPEKPIEISTAEELARIGRDTA